MPVPYSPYQKMGITVTKDKAGGDAAQVPASGVTVAVYKRGAFSDRIQTIASAASGVTLFLNDSTMLAANDVLQLGAAGTPSCTVQSVPNVYQAVVNGDGNGALVLAAGSHLVIKGPGGRIPTIYGDPFGTVTLTPPLLTDANGYAECWVKEQWVDLILSGGGITTTVRKYEKTGAPVNWINAADYPSIQAAIDAAPVAGEAGLAGATVYIPPGLYTESININKRIRITGAGARLSVLAHATNNTDVITVSDGDEVTIEEMGTLWNGAAGTGRAVVAGKLFGFIGNLTIRNCHFARSPSHAIHLLGKPENTNYSGTSNALIENINIEYPKSGHCIYGAQVWTTEIRNSHITSNLDTVFCVYLRQAMACLITTCDFEVADNGTGVKIEADVNPAWSITMIGNDFEPLPGNEATLFVHIKDARQCNMMNNYFLNGVRAVHFEDCFAPALVNNNYVNMSTGDVLLTDCLNAVFVNDFAAGAAGAFTPRAMKWTEAGSTLGTIAIANGAVQLPRYTTTQRDALDAANSVIAGALIYNTTTEKINFLRNDGTTWAAVTSV